MNPENPNNPALPDGETPPAAPVTDNAPAPAADPAAAPASATPPAEEKEEEKKPEKGTMSLANHMRELRRVLVRVFIGVVIGFFICYYFVETLQWFVYEPLLKVKPEGSDLIYTGMPDAFIIQIKIAFVASCFLCSPFIFYQIWQFIGPGLYDSEKRFVLPVAFFSAFCFIGGGAFCYLVVFPFAFEFFMSYSKGPYKAMPSMTQYFSFTLQMLLAFGMVFEMPLFTFFLSRMGVVTAKTLRKFRRYAVVLAFIVAAILTPPDVYSQMLMAIPILLLYEASILIAAIFGKKKDDPDKKTKKEAERPEEAKA